MAITTADFRNGIVIETDKGLMEIVEFQHVKPGKGPAFVRTKQKSLATGRVIERTYRSGERFEEARVEDQTWQFLYADGDIFHFMHPETFDQMQANREEMGDSPKFLKENDNLILVFHDGKVIGTKLPASVELKITQSDPGVQGDRSSGATKPATLETGLVIQVPLFVEEGQVVKVDTRTGEYMERVN